MKRYRFKTKKEFEDEFGPNWRKVVKWQFPTSMDYLLGSPIRKEYNWLIEHNMDIIGYSSPGSWSISKDMISECALELKINKLLKL